MAQHEHASDSANLSGEADAHGRARFSEADGTGAGGHQAGVQLGLVRVANAGQLHVFVVTHATALLASRFSGSIQGKPDHETPIGGRLGAGAFVAARTPFFAVALVFIFEHQAKAIHGYRTFSRQEREQVATDLEIEFS